MSTILLGVAASFQNKKKLVTVKGTMGFLLPHLLEAKPIYEALLSANKSLGFNWEAAAAEDVVICI